MTTPSNRSQKGQALVEFTLALVTFLFLLTGAIDVARMFFAQMIITEASQEGAIYGSFQPTDSEGMEARVRTNSTGYLDLTDTDSVHVDISYSGEKCADGNNAVIVNVTYDFPVIMPLTEKIFGEDKTLSATSIAVILSPTCP
jgi:Flp pilus assembly protein TadG